MTRSPACELLFNESALYETRSAGTSHSAVKYVTQELIDWADTIIVMCERTDGHATYLKEHFDLQHKPVIDLDVPDFIYDRSDDPALHAVLTEKLKPYFTIPYAL